MCLHDFWHVLNHYSANNFKHSFVLFPETILSTGYQILFPLIQTPFITQRIELLLYNRWHIYHDCVEPLHDMMIFEVGIYEFMFQD